MGGTGKGRKSCLTVCKYYLDSELNWTGLDYEIVDSLEGWGEGEGGLLLLVGGLQRLAMEVPFGRPNLDFV